jgi:hypothetical protein
LLFDEKDNDHVVDEADSSSEEGDYREDEDHKDEDASPDIQSIFSQLNLNELNPPAKSSTMISNPYFQVDF